VSDRFKEGILKRVRYWLDGQPEDGERGIPAFLVTRERLYALGLSRNEVERAMHFVNDPYNHGIDPYLTHEDRLNHADRWRAMQGSVE
jgi:hypothetical protein